VRKIAKSVLSAVHHCHSQEVVVRCLTADNLSVRREGREGFQVKIADFSLAVPGGSLDVLCDHPLFEWNDVPFMAPEALLGHPYSFAMDVWSVGVLVYLMLSGELPFASPDDKALIEQIKVAAYSTTTVFNNSCVKLAVLCRAAPSSFLRPTRCGAT